VEADELDPDIGLRGFQSSYWYEQANVTLAIPIMVKKESYFEITGSDAELRVGENEGIIEVTYKNTGEEVADDAIARLSVFKPYSINSEIKYTDLRGETIISDSMKIPVNVNTAKRSYAFPAVVILIVLVAGGASLYRRRR